ncbi:Hypothetical protein PBC10988_3860 [Planctomycetales bacterium 10988]|nr:Hypothetical protein PBC10988_3860 [Planctomycetales bacterium 10988]
MFKFLPLPTMLVLLLFLPELSYSQSALQRLEDILRQGRESMPEQTPPNAPPPTRSTPPGQAPGYLGLIADDRQENGRGVRILEVLPNSPAQASGLEAQDLIIAVDSDTVQSMSDLGRQLQGSVAGQRLMFQVERDGQRRLISVTLGERPNEGDRAYPQFGQIPNASEDPNAAMPQDARRALMGVRTIAVTESDRRALRLPTNLGAKVASVRPSSPASNAGIIENDVIVAIENEVINTPDELSSTVGTMQPGTTIEVSLFRNGDFRRVNVTLGEALPTPEEVTPNFPSPTYSDPSEESYPSPSRIEQLEQMVYDLSRRVTELERALDEQDGTPSYGPLFNPPLRSPETETETLPTPQAVPSEEESDSPTDSEEASSTGSDS